MKCKKERCEQFCPLRYLKSEEEFDCQQVLPTEKRPLAFVCRVCGSLSEHSAQDIRKTKLQRQGLDQLPAPTVIYQMTFQCGQKNCGLPIEVYTEVDSGRDEKENAKRNVFHWALARSCPNGHQSTPLNDQSFQMLLAFAEVSPIS